MFSNWYVAQKVAFSFFNADTPKLCSFHYANKIRRDNPTLDFFWISFLQRNLSQ